MRNPTSSSPFALLAGAATLALALAACGGGDTGTSGGGAPGSPSPAESVEADPDLVDQVPEAISSDGTITVGTDATYAPNEFLDADGQTVIGFDIDLFRAVAAKLGLDATFTPAPFSAIIPGVSSGKYEIGVSSFTISADRVKQTNMVSYFNAGTLWAVQKGNPKNFSVDDICGKTVGVQTGTTQESPDVSGRSKACTDAGKPAINIVTLKTQTDVTTRLVNGSIDAMSADSPIIGYALSQTGGKLEVLGDVYDAAPQGIAVAKGDPALAEVMSKVMNKLISDGTYKKILEAWNNSAGAVTKSEVNPAVTS